MYLDVPGFSTNDLSLSQGSLQDPTLHVVIPSSTVPLLSYDPFLVLLVFHDLFK